MPLAIFDLDNTLIAGDSDHCWGEFLCTEGLVKNPLNHAEQNDIFHQAYQDGNLNITAYLEFTLKPITGMTSEEVKGLQDRFMANWIEPLLLPAAFDLLNRHREAGDELLIITATNAVVTQPIAERLNVEALIACGVEMVNDVYTGYPTGIPSFREGKISRLDLWLKARKSISTEQHQKKDAWFYSDSHNDLPLLESVGNPIAVDPDDTLKKVADERGWPVISLR